MRNRMLVLAIVALILSGGVTYLAYRLLQRRLQPPEATTSLVVAAKKLDLGARITKEDVKLVQWPKSTPIEGGFTDPNQVIDRGLLVAVQINEPILESKLAPKGMGAGLTTVIPDGMRALSIQVNSIIGVAGFVVPGSHVDMILTAVPPPSVKGTRVDETASKIILENLEVLAAGQNVQRDVDGKPQTVQDVTLLLTPEQAQRVALATGDGRIQLALRNPMDKGQVESPLVLRSALFEGRILEGAGLVRSKTAEAPAKMSGSRKVTVAKAKPTPVPVAAPAPPPRMVSVELIQGSRRETKSFEEEKP